MPGIPSAETRQLSCFQPTGLCFCGSGALEEITTKFIHSTSGCSASNLKQLRATPCPISSNPCRLTSKLRTRCIQIPQLPRELLEALLPDPLVPVLTFADLPWP